MWRWLSSMWHISRIYWYAKWCFAVWSTLSHWFFRTFKTPLTALHLYSFAQRIFVLSASIYLCERVFSATKWIKLKIRIAVKMSLWNSSENCNKREIAGLYILVSANPPSLPINWIISRRDYWVIGICPSSGILKNTKEHNVSETGSVSVLGWGSGRHVPCWVR
jgi:hypothetical protein